MVFEFVFKLVTGVLLSEMELKSKGHGIIATWLALQLAPLGIAGLKFVPNFTNDIIHTVRLLFFVIKYGYKKLYNAIYGSASSLLDESEKLGMKREEADHNLVFLSAFNTFGGMKVMFLFVIKWIVSGGEGLHRCLAEEIRAVVKEEGGVTFFALERMPLTKSAVYEVLRIDPLVSFQYAKAREDIVVENHDDAFEIKKGEIILEYQRTSTKDMKVFENPEDFIADRFLCSKAYVLNNAQSLKMKSSQS